MRFVATLALACLAGCVTTAAEVREEGARTVHKLQMPPEQAAGCLARNADQFPMGGFLSQVRALPRKGEYEVVVTIDGGLGPNALFVMEVVPDGPGSSMQLWAYRFLMQSREDAFRAHVVRGC